MSKIKIFKSIVKLTQLSYQLVLKMGQKLVVCFKMQARTPENHKAVGNQNKMQARTLASGMAGRLLWDANILSKPNIPRASD